MMVCRRPLGNADQPKSVAADMVHVRIDDGDRRRHRHHRFERVAAFGEDRAAGFRRRHDAARKRRRGDVRLYEGPCRLVWHGNFSESTLAQQSLRSRQPAAESLVGIGRVLQLRRPHRSCRATASPLPGRRCRRSPRRPRRHPRRAPPTTCSCNRPPHSRRPRTHARSAAADDAWRSRRACRCGRAPPFECAGIDVLRRARASGNRDRRCAEARYSTVAKPWSKLRAAISRRSRSSGSARRSDSAWRSAAGLPAARANARRAATAARRNR